MQVIDNKKLEPNQVLIGKKGKVGKATVTNDPILMSMLSKGLYANPLKSMVQEITFNAWDAHRMDNCLDKPIDIYFNDTTGFMVRDYGPGIPPGKTFTDIYFTYGGSTKRDDADATGGFGLGSKSPFAYTDTFNVTNHHKGEKYMHIMHRIHEDNDGGPGHTPIIEGVPTTEKGLLVSVGFNTQRDKIQAYHYLTEILYMSGIKATIHYEGLPANDIIPPIKLVNAESLKPGQFTYSNEKSRGGIYAVYGGVSYEIPYREEYHSDFYFFKTISNNLGGIYIGFAPNTLTPLPTREGLNMGELSVESITTSLETIQECFTDLMYPAMKTLMLETLKHTKTLGLPPLFVIQKWKNIGIRETLNSMFHDKSPVSIAIACRKEGYNESTWDSLCHLGFNNTYTIFKLLGDQKLDNLQKVVWSKVYPDLKDWRHALGIPNKDNSKVMLKIINDHQKTWGQEFIQMWKELCDITSQKLEPRFHYGTSKLNYTWNLATNIHAIRSHSVIVNPQKIKAIKRLNKTSRYKVPIKLSLNTLWDKKDFHQIEGPMMNKTIIVAKTITSLKKTNFLPLIHSAMFPNYTKDTNTYNWLSWCGSKYCPQFPIGAFVIHKKRGQYDTAVKWLKDNGWTVLEADEPAPVLRTPKVLTGATEVEFEKPKGYPKVMVESRKTWKHPDDFIQNPTTYLYLTQRQINPYNDHPDKKLVKLIQQEYPDMVMANDKKTAEKLDKQGVLSMWERLNEIVKNILSDKKRLRLLYIYYFLHKKSSLPNSFLESTHTYKLMNMPTIGSSVKNFKKFIRDRQLLESIIQINPYYHDNISPDLRDKILKAFKEVHNDDSLVLVYKIANASKLFNSNNIDNKITNMSNEEKKIFTKNLIRFLRNA